jgi:hypothetical protein
MPRRHAHGAGATDTARRTQAGTKVAASLATVGAVAGLVLFAHVGAHEDGNDPFPHSVITPTR